MFICECGKKLKIKNIQHIISNIHLAYLQKNINQHLNNDDIEYKEIEIKNKM